ncbi:hypothetical protein HDU87_004116 [Geranomyces variabilis]|uniref:Glyoxalase/fosfomycin resistance/dioxygenase domain-containing protein n=1 Tax=Geranomyces variabilis TaxID=109894 RepID=A0AAD5TR56_9FUNG|nr:hypothetical protein HDU87_004116 [Geranomyces variabilis]
MFRTRTPGTPSSHTPERYIFKYIRLKCSDVPRTIDFYQNLGMSIDWEAEQSAFVPPPVEKDKDKERERDRDKREVQELLADKEQKEKVVSMSYRPTGKDVGTHNVQLVLEQDASVDPLGDYVSPAVDEEGRERFSRDPAVGGRVPHNYEYLVIYVHFVHRLAKRLQGKGFEVLLEPIAIAEVKMCIMKDPNGLEVRLMELTDSQLNVPSTKKQWYARLGYYVLPTGMAETTVRWYETILATTRTRTPQGQRITTLDLAGGRTPRKRDGGGMESKVTTPAGNMKKPGTAASVRQAITQGQGFRLVDTEDFIVGLSRSLYYWLGNDLRSASCSICFTEHADFGAKSDADVYVRKASKLMSFGFEVPNLDAAVNQLRYEFKEDLDWGRERYRIHGVGLAARLYDKINLVWIELFAAKGGEREASVREGEEPAAGTATAIAKAKKIEYAIDFNHLAGHARVLSAGAVYRVKKPEDTNITQPERAAILAQDAAAPAELLRTASASSDISESVSQTSSSASLHMVGRSNDDIRPQPPGEGKPAAGHLRNSKAVREARAAREQRYLFLSKTKSGSAMW